MARYDDRRDARPAFGRYSGAQAADDRHRQEGWRHGGHGSGWQPGRDTDRDDGMDRGDYYDPDHEYRTRRYQRDSDSEEPYRERPMPGEFASRGRDRHITPQRAEEEHAWSQPSSWFGEGPHRGVGPKGYVRSDPRIHEQVCEYLMEDPHLDASNIEVAVKDGEVTLSGTVGSRAARRHAETLAESTGGVKHVQNNLRVSA